MALDGVKRNGQIRVELPKEFVRAELANLRYQMLAAHVASFIGLALLIVFRT